MIIQSVWSGNSNSSQFNDSFCFLYLIAKQGLYHNKHQSITCNSNCMHVKEQKRKLTFISYLSYSCLSHFFSSPSLSFFFLHRYRRRYFSRSHLSVSLIWICNKTQGDRVQYYFCRTSFLLISISLETQCVSFDVSISIFYSCSNYLTN